MGLKKINRINYVNTYFQLIVLHQFTFLVRFHFATDGLILSTPLNICDPD